MDNDYNRYTDTKTHEESLINTINEIIRYLKIQDNDVVLDAGCGSGEATRYVVEKYAVETVGITMSDELLKAAHRLSHDIHNKDLIKFYNKDYCDTGFDNESFTKIYAIESVCYAVDKKDFIRESFRLLKNGGKLVVSDAYQVKFDLDEYETKIFQEWVDGFYMPDISKKIEFYNNLENQGFKNIRFIEHTDLIKKSMELMNEGSTEKLPGIYLKTIQKKIPESRLKHYIALCRQKECIERGIWIHGRFVAEKV